MLNIGLADEVYACLGNSLKHKNYSEYQSKGGGSLRVKSYVYWLGNVRKFTEQPSTVGLSADSAIKFLQMSESS